MAARTAGPRPTIDKVRFNLVKDSPDAYIAFAQGLGDKLRKWQGREAMENLSRDITFSIGKELTKTRIIEAVAGDVKSAKWLKRFGLLVDADITKLKGAELEAALNKTAKNFVDANQGTYGMRG